MDVELLKKSIQGKLPQIPYVIDQVGEALKWAQEELDEGEFYSVLEITDEVAEYVASISDPNFYKTHLVVASILTNITDACNKERFSKFDTTSKAVEKALHKLGMTPDDVEKKGCFKACLLQLVPLAKEDESLFAIALMGIRHCLNEILKGMKEAEIKTPVTSSDYITVLGYAWVMANLRMANLCLLSSTHKIYNDILVMLNNDVNY